MTRGTGFRPDPPGIFYPRFRQDHPAGMRLCGSELPDYGGPDGFAPNIWNQSASSSCVGHGEAGAITTVCGSLGRPLPRPASPKFCYQMGLMKERASLNPIGALPPLVDNGTSPSLAASGLRTYGLVLEGDVKSDRCATDPDYGDWISAHVTDEPKLGDFELADTRHFLADWTQVDDGAPDKITQLAEALASGYPFCLAVDASHPDYQNCNSLDPLDYESGDWNHYNYCTFYKTDAAGARLFLVRNSWGLDWGSGGCYWASERFIRAAGYTLIPRLS